MGKAPRFDAAWNRRRRWRARLRRWWAGAAPVLLLALVLGGWWMWRDTGGGTQGEWVPVAATFKQCGPGAGTACVVDGDTLWLADGSPHGTRVRLTGYDAPELDGACEAEKARARQARTALLAWLAQGSFEWDGGADPPRDKYGRQLRTARRGSDMLADHMIRAGLAEGSGWGAVQVDWCG